MNDFLINEKYLSVYICPMTKEIKITGKIKNIEIIKGSTSKIKHKLIPKYIIPIMKKSIK